MRWLETSGSPITSSTSTASRRPQRLSSLDPELQRLGLEHAGAILESLSVGEELGLELGPGRCPECGGSPAVRFVVEGPRCAVALCRSCARRRRRAAVLAGLVSPEFEGLEPEPSAR